MNPRDLFKAWIALAALVGVGAQAAELVIDAGVAVRFGSNAQMIVRDKLTLAPSVVLSSDTDDVAGGQIGTTPGTASGATWRGLQIEKSSQAYSATDLSGLTVRHAGSSDTAAVAIRGPLANINGAAPKWKGLVLSDNAVGLRLFDGAAPSIQESSFLRNATAIEARDGSPAKISSSQFAGNTVYAVNNLTPATSVTASGNWWGHASGPRNASTNPSGQGDAVSSGVAFGPYLTYAPLIDCWAAPVAGYFASTPTISIALHCVNATQYRLSEAGDFAGSSLSPMAAQVGFALSAGPGYKTIHAQFADNAGHTVTTVLPQAITYNPGTPIIPVVALSVPAEGAILAANTVIAATASDSFGIAKVEFLVDGTLLATSPGNPPYSTAWNLTSFANGAHTITAVATNTSGYTASDSRSVTVAKVLPSVNSLYWAGSPLAAGATITAPGQLAAQLSAPGEIQSASLAIDGTPVSGATLSGSTLSAFLDFNAIANGSHALTVTVTDKVGGVGSATFNFQLAIPVPPPPTIQSPAQGATVRQATVAVTGSGVAGTQVQLYVDGVAVGPLFGVNANGNFAGSVTLPGEGQFAITAINTGGHGTSAAGTPVQITYTVAAPTVTITSPAEGATVAVSGAISIAVTDSTAISRVDLAIDGSTVSSLTSAPYSYTWDIAGVADGTHTLTATAVNQAGKSGQATRTVTVQKAPPPPPPIVTPYTGTLSSVTPTISYGEQAITIAGTARDRTTNQPVANAALKLILQVAGFQRSINLATDASGAYTYVFTPQASDAGTYELSVIHPQESTLSPLGQFTIDRLRFNPTVANVSVARGFAQNFSIAAIASAGNGASNVHFAVNAEDQPSGSLPTGIAVDTSASVNVPAGHSVAVPLSLTAGAGAAASGTVVLAGYAGASGGAKRGTVTVNYHVYEPTPALFAAPTQIETGVAQGAAVSETLTVENRGLIAAQGLTAQLLNNDGSSNVPPWIYLASASQLGTLDVGAKQTLQITAAPDGSVTNGIYSFKLRVHAQNAPGGDIPVSVSVTQTGAGGMRFQMSDIYTNTLNAQGLPIPGLAGATVKVQNVDVLTVQQSAVSDANGVATFSGLPTGSYSFRASAPNHTDTSGRFQIRPAVDGNQAVFLDYALVNVEFSVTETTVQDHYDVVVTATYQTQVPAAVVLVEPMSINIPDMQVGEEVTGELTITNYGLVRADNVVFTPPVSDAYYRFEVYGTVPTTLEAKQRITLPYKVTSLAPLPAQGSISSSASAAASAAVVAARQSMVIPTDMPSVTGNANRVTSIEAARQRNSLAARKLPIGAVTAASGGGCLKYSSGYGVSCSYDCAAGDTRSCGGGGGFNRVYGGCGGGPSNGTWGGEGGGVGGGWGSGTISGPSPMPMTPQCAPSCSSCVCSAAGGGHGGS